MKRARQEVEYAKLRKTFLAEHPWCQRDGYRSTDVHHMRGRRGALLLAVEHWAALCRPCHRLITENPALAYAEGWSQKRNGAA